MLTLRACARISTLCEPARHLRLREVWEAWNAREEERHTAVAAARPGDSRERVIVDQNVSPF